MDNEDIENTVQLPEEVILHIAQFLEREDALALSLAFLDVYPTVPSIYWKKIQENSKSVSISQCYNLRDVSWMRELEHNKELANILTSFNASHYFRLPVEALLETLSRMPNLEQLIIHDTKISLAHLPRIFKSCMKLNKLSFTLAEENLDEFAESKMGQENFSWLMKGFKRLTHLKLFTFNLDDENCCSSWLVTFGVLGWCSSRCIDLHIEVAYPPACYSDECPVIFDPRQSFMGEKHAWMSSVKSLVFIARGGGSLPRDSFVHYFLKRYARKREPNSMERLWIEKQSMFDVNTLNWYTGDVPLTKSLVLWPEDQAYFTHGDYDGLRQLEHVADVPFSRLANYPSLKYIRGYCTDEEGLNEFCTEHPMLEHLHFSTAEEFPRGEDDTTITVGNWSLPHLKTIVYRCSFPVKEIIDHLIVACGNIEALHIGKLDDLTDPSSLPIVDVTFLSAIKFSKLTSLSLNGFQLSDGSYMASIIQQCPKLQSLHLSGIVQPGAFLRQLGECLPRATHLHDLRIQLFNREEEADVLGFLNKLRGCSKHLKRLVFYTQELCDFTGPTAAAELRTFLTSFPLQMRRLELLYIVGIDFDTEDAEIKRYWKEELSPARPGFALYLGDYLPFGNNPKDPRIHMDGIVSPIDWFRAPPHFDDIDSQEIDD